MFTDGVFEGWILMINFGMKIHFDAWAGAVCENVVGAGYHFNTSHRVHSATRSFTNYYINSHGHRPHTPLTTHAQRMSDRNRSAEQR